MVKTVLLSRAANGLSEVIPGSLLIPPEGHNMTPWRSYTVRVCLLLVSSKLIITLWGTYRKLEEVFGQIRREVV